MNKRDNIRDDTFAGRLSSILMEKGGLSPRKILRIKYGVYYLLTTTGEEFVIKGYRRKGTVDYQWSFFEQWQTNIGIKFVLFPSGGKTINGLGFNWSAAPYQRSTTLSFVSHEKRSSVCRILQQFHQETKGIKVSNPLLQNPLYVKYIARTRKFSKTAELMKEHGYGSLYYDIFFKADQLITLLRRFNWHLMEQNSVHEWTWTHGDVASHNFLSDTEGGVYLIDFDMLGLSPVIYDWIQLGQRFLPHLNYKLNRLLDYPFPVKEGEMELFIQGVCMPADLIREWFYFLSSQPDTELYPPFLQRLEQQWEQRLQMIREANIILN